MISTLVAALLHCCGGIGYDGSVGRDSLCAVSSVPVLRGCCITLPNFSSLPPPRSTHTHKPPPPTQKTSAGPNPPLFELRPCLDHIVRPAPAGGLHQALHPDQRFDVLGEPVAHEVERAVWGDEGDGAVVLEAGLGVVGLRGWVGVGR